MGFPVAGARVLEGADAAVIDEFTGRAINRACIFEAGARVRTNTGAGLPAAGDLVSLAPRNWPMQAAIAQARWIARPAASRNQAQQGLPEESDENGDQECDRDQDPKAPGLWSPALNKRQFQGHAGISNTPHSKDVSFVGIWITHPRKSGT